MFQKDRSVVTNTDDTGKSNRLKHKNGNLSFFSPVHLKQKGKLVSSFHFHSSTGNLSISFAVHKPKPYTSRPMQHKANQFCPPYTRYDSISNIHAIRKQNLFPKVCETHLEFS